MKLFNKQIGVTLIELVISVSVVSILVGFSAPSYSKFISKRELAGAANMITVFVEAVKMESIKRNQFATISFQKEDGGENWCLGATLGKDAPCDCMAETTQCLIDSVPNLLSNSTYKDFDDIETTFTDGHLTFDPVRGILTEPDSSLQMQIGHSEEDAYLVNVVVNATGRVRKCSPSDHQLIGFATCI